MALTIKGRRLSLAWLKPPPMPPDGNMTLFEHLRELRYRLVMMAIAVLVTAIICIVLYSRPFGGLYGLLTNPYLDAMASLQLQNPETSSKLVTNGLAAGFTFGAKLVAVSAIILASPVILYQLWAFIMPGLLAKEKKWALIFVSAATPLFLAGVAIGYTVMPKAIYVLVAFNPKGVENLIDLQTFLSFMLRLMVVFGIAFLIPLAVLLLNQLGVIPAKYLTKFRVFIIFGCFVFGAVATPSTDPVSMLALAAPMTVLFLVCEFLATMNDRRRAKRSDNPDQLDTVLQRLKDEDARAKGEAEAPKRGGIAGTIIRSLPAGVTSSHRSVDAESLKNQIAALSSDK